MFRSHGQLPFSAQKGMALLGALVLIALVGIVTGRVLQSTSTEIAISGYHKRSVEGLYAAESGLAEAQARLWKHPGAEPYFFYDPSQGYANRWVAYLLATPDWRIQDDPTWDSGESPYFPLPGNPLNTAARLNSVQSTLSYWVKVRHKTERDAEQDGHQVVHPHYMDEDGSLARHRGSNRGAILYFGYSAGSRERPVQFSVSSQSPYLPVERVMAYSVGKGQTTRIQADLVHDPGPPQLATVVAQTRVMLSGGQGVINGQDGCGAVASLAPVASGQLLEPTPTFQLLGIPPRPILVTYNLDLPGRVSGFQHNAIMVSGPQRGRVWGTTAMPVTVFASVGKGEGADGLLLDQVTGDGIFAVNGRVQIRGPVTWDGLMIVSGSLIVEAPGSTVSVRGGIWAGELEVREGAVNVQYDSCAIRAALLTRPLRLLNWRELD